MFRIEPMMRQSGTFNGEIIKQIKRVFLLNWFRAFQISYRLLAVDPPQGITLCTFVLEQLQGFRLWYLDQN